MKKIFILAGIAATAFIGCQSNSESTQETTVTTDSTQNVVDDGFTSIFNGKDLSGWHTYGKSVAGAAWSVQDGALTFDPHSADDQRGDLITDKEYENFDLKLEWKISKEGNSGIIFLVHEDTTKYQATYMTGPEMQVLDNDGHPDAKIIKHRAGDLYDLITSAQETVKKVGEWNQAEIICKKDSLTFFLNGSKVVETSIHDQKWKDMVAGSKFKQWLDFGTFTKGHIALQDHGNEVWYRNIQIKEL